MTDTEYLQLITSAYQLNKDGDASVFKTWVAANIGVVSDITTVLDSFTTDFDLASAVGAQLDIVGSIVGASRIVSLDNQTVSLVDDDFRNLIRAKVVNNHWDGKKESLYAAWNSLFPEITIVLLDNQDMTVNVLVSGGYDPIVWSLIINDYIVPRPQGVLYNNLQALLPMFGFDTDTDTLAGFDKGHWSSFLF